MREIKFRAKAKFSGTLGSAKWIYSSLMRLDAATHRLNLGGLDCDIETLGQFTGLLDENGKDIYEGDVISGGLLSESCEVMYHESCARFIAYGEHYKVLAHKFSQFEVIGNIHDNPELLERA